MVGALQASRRDCQKGGVMKTALKPPKPTIRTQLVTLANLSGLDNTERDLVAQFLAKPKLSEVDAVCVRAMAARHLTSRGGR